jgi:hypothetical protein
MFAGMRPDLPVLCCTCSEMSMAVIQRALPDIQFMRRDVPDLARSGMFN